MALEHRIREAIDAFHSRMRHDIESHVRGLTFDVLRIVQENQDEWRAQFDRGGSDARDHADRGFRARLDQERAGPVREAEPRATLERVELQTSLFTTSGGQRVDTLRRLVAAIRQIDEAVTLTGILEALARGVSAEASRVAILLVDADRLRVWGHVGFAVGQTPTDLPVAHAGGLAAAMALRHASVVSASANRDSATPDFMRVPPGRTGFIVPLTVGGDVVAVLYADDAGKSDDVDGAASWTEEVDVLARHAALRLENVTSLRTVEVLSK